MKYLFNIITIIFACSLIAPLQAKKLDFQQANGIAREMLGQSRANKATKRLILSAALKTAKSKKGSYYSETKLRDEILSMLAPVAPKASPTGSSTSKASPKNNPVAANPIQANMSIATSSSSTSKKSLELNKLVVNGNRNTHLQPTDKNQQGKKIVRKNYLETRNQHGMNIELMQIQGILQGELGDLGAGTCGPLAIYHAIMMTNYCLEGNAQYLLDLIDQQKAKTFLQATGTIQNACEEQLDGILAHATTEKLIAQKSDHMIKRIGHINTISIPGEHITPEKARLAAFVPIYDSVKTAIKQFRDKNSFCYALIIADIEPGKYGHYYCLVINKINKEHTQFIIIDSGSCDHFAITRKKQILDSLINLFIVYPDNLL